METRITDATACTQERMLICGAGGFLGNYFRFAYPEALTPPLDIAEPVAVAGILDAVSPRVVVNCAAKTGRPNVDWCENHRRQTLRSNVAGPLVLAEACARRDIYFVHISSGCIYEGDSGGTGFSEDAPPNFSGSFYSCTKAWAEQCLRGFPVLVLRLRMPFDGSTSSRNLLMKLRSYRRVLKAPNSLTHLPDFLRAATALIACRATGIFNIVNEGALSPFEIMELYREIVDPDHEFEALSPGELDGLVRAKRSNCLLSTAKLRNAGLALPSVGAAVEAALVSLKEELLTADRDGATTRPLYVPKARPLLSTI
jgi:dTDP-4-dehydrorhamnose reductase